MEYLPTFEEFKQQIILDKELGFYKNVNYRKSFLETIISENIFGSTASFALNIIVETNQVDELFLNGLNEESIAKKIKSKIDTAKELIRKGTDSAKEKGENILAKVKEIGGNFMNFIKKIMKSLEVAFTKAWEHFQKAVTKVLDSAKKTVMDKAKKIGAKGHLGEEIKNLSKMTKWAVDYFTKGVVKDMGSGMVKAGKSNESYSFYESIEASLWMTLTEYAKNEKENFIDEYANLEKWLENETIYEDEHGHDHGPKIPFLSTLAHKLNEYPPFKWLDKMAKFFGKFAGNMLEKFSAGVSKFFGAPGSFKFPTFGNIIGLFAEAKAKNTIKHVVLDGGVAVVSSLIPFTGIIYKCLKWTAEGIWYTEFAQEILKVAGKKDNHKEEKSDEESF